MKEALFRGTATALITPFTDSGIDYSALDRLLQMQIEAKVPALVITGTTGEASTLSTEEKIALWRYCVYHVGSACEIIAGIGSNSTAASVSMAKIAAACGVDGLLATLIWPEGGELARMLGGVASQIGHVFPVYFGFRGGKGILTAGGVALAMNWRVFVPLFAAFLIVFLLTKYVSLGSVVAAAAYPVGFWICYPGEYGIIALAALMGVLAVFMHRGNIKRLLQGQERKTYLHSSKNKEEKP